MATLKASPEIIDLMKAQSAEINRLRDEMETFAVEADQCGDPSLAHRLRLACSPKLCPHLDDEL